MEQTARNTMTITAQEHRQQTRASAQLAEECGLAIASASYTTYTTAGRTRHGTPMSISMLGLRRSFAAAAERDLLFLLNRRLGGAGVNHGARNP